MEILYFTEQPMSAYPEDKATDEVPIGGGKTQRITSLLFSNKYFDPMEGSRLYRERIEEWKLVDESGFDGIMLNEHHTAPFCMSPRVNLFAAILATVTKNVKIVLLGNPLPLWDNPVHLAEELSIIDMISQGRLVSGFVRGGGVENIQANTNPSFNRERLEEAHDLLMEAWTKEGPFRWEGRHFDFRVVNPWATPYHRPHPPIWIPGVASKETVIWAAQQGYPYIGLNTNFDVSAKIRELYAGAAAEAGITAGPEHFGQLLQCHVADTEEKAEQNAKEFMWMRGEFTGLAHPVWGSPTGYGSRSNRNSLIEISAGRRPLVMPPPINQRRLERTFVWGTPKTVVEQLKVVLENNRPGVLALWGNDGRIDHADSKRCIELLGKEVLPEIREFSQSLGIKSPMETGAGYNRNLGTTPKEYRRIEL
ncbi:MAG: LLM class flavin-dependent oxidoreductase [Dehalococcoidia bacterium]|nr:LLM class flavin-dependent oxidoreductase [Dehalococcoidia bacterium]